MTDADTVRGLLGAQFPVLPYHRTRRPGLAAVAERTIREVTSEGR